MYWAFDTAEGIKATGNGYQACRGIRVDSDAEEEAKGLKTREGFTE